MRKALIKTVIFFGLLVLLAYAVGWFLDKQMKQLNYEDASVWNEISRGGIDANVIIIGSSRAATHIDPRIITAQTGLSCYNLGMMGHNFFIENARYQYYLQHNKAPQYIILSLDYESLQKRPDLFNYMQFAAYLNEPIIANACKQYEGFSSFDYHIPVLKYSGEQTLIFSLIKNALWPARNKADRVKGFYARDLYWNDEVDKTLDSLKPYTVVPDSLSIKSFIDFLNYTKAQHIHLAFVHSPVHPLGQAKVLNRNSIIRYYDSIAQAYHIPFIDYANDTMCSIKKYMMNSTHLNAQGAEVFSHKLVQDLINKGWLVPSSQHLKK